jgi:hypothetical protein
MTQEITLSFKLPASVSLTRLILNDKGSWEASCVRWSEPDRYGVVIPAQIGYAFKQHTAERAIELAGQDAAAKFAQLKQRRNSRPAPGAKPLSEEEELMKLLDLG